MVAPPIDPVALYWLTRSYGLFLLLTLLQLTPQAPRFLLGERWGGYGDRSRWTEALHNPIVLALVLPIWLTSAAALIAGVEVVWAAAVNLALCRYYFISMRWRSVLRCMGAPGFLTYWAGAAVFLLELGARWDPSGRILEAASFVFRIDLAVIMICAGSYKAIAGYAANSGMELGMINPAWGYWGGFYRGLPPSHLIFRLLNHLAYGTEIVAGVLMLLPSTQVWGAALIFLSFAWILTHIRLGWLCEMVMLACLVYLPRGHAWVAVLPVPNEVVEPARALLPAGAASLIAATLWMYVALLPFAKVGQWYNFLARRRFAAPLQFALERYTNFFGIIIWRVFSADLTNFYLRVSIEDPLGKRVSYSDRRSPDAFLRYWHVGENICLTSLFTTLKYYPSRAALFRERLVRYARTVPARSGDRVVFEYMAMEKFGDRFTDRLVAEYAVDVETAHVAERILVPGFSPRQPSPDSPVNEGVHPGSYAPAKPVGSPR